MRDTPDSAGPTSSSSWPHAAVAAAAVLLLVGPAVPVSAEDPAVDVTRCYEAGHGWGGFDNETLERVWLGQDPPRLWGDGGFLPQAASFPGGAVGTATGCDDVADVWGVRVRPSDIPDDLWGEAVEVRADIDDARADHVIGTVCSVTNGDEYCGNQQIETLAPFCGSTGWVDVEAGWGALGVIVGNVAHSNFGCGRTGDRGGGSQGTVHMEIRAAG